MDSPLPPDGTAATLGEDVTSPPKAKQRRGLEPGTQLGRYVATEQLGRGGMGEVWLAHDTELDRDVAIKVVRADKRARARGRMLREAQAQARLRHPNVVAVHDVGTWGQSVFVAMEYVRGTTLDGWQKASARSVAEIVAMYVGAGRGLAAAHAAGLVHRDFKPENVMVDGNGRAQVTDFGLARAPESVSDDSGLLESGASGPVAVAWLEDDEELSSPSLVSQRLTATGAVLGTPAYMAPEQHVGTGTDSRSDQFAFAVALYEALYGERPYGGHSIIEIAANVTSGPIHAPPKDHNVPSRLRDVLVRGLQRDASDRFASMEQFIEHLHDALRPRRGPQLAVGGTLGLGGIVVATMLLGGTDDPCASAAETVTVAWTEPARATVESAFGESNVGFAADTFERMAAELDTYAAQLHNEAGEACRDTHTRGVQSQVALDQRLGCIRQRERALTAFVGLAVTADADFVEHAVMAVGALPSVRGCSELGGEATQLPDLPDDVATALSEAEVNLTLARYAQAEATLEPFVASLSLEPPSPALVAVLSTHSVAAYELGRPGGGIPQQERALWMATELGLDREIVQAATSLAARNMHTGPAVVARWLAHADAVYKRYGDDDHRSAIDIVWTSYLLQQGDLDAAETLVRRWAAYQPDGLSDKLLRMAFASQGARILHRRGKLKDARGALLALVAEASDILGPGHPFVARQRIALAQLLATMGLHEEAKAQEQLSLATLESAYAKDGERMDSLLQNLSVQQMRRGEFDKAVPYLELSLQRAQSAAIDSLAVAESASMLGVAYWYLERYAEAEQMHRRARELSEARRGPDHPRTAMFTDNLACALERQGKVDEALKLHATSLPILEAAYGMGSPIVATSLRDHARARASAEDFAGAVELLERSLRIFKAAEAGPRDVAETGFDLARILWRDNAAQPRAISLAYAAREGYQGPETAKERAEVDRWLAEHITTGTAVPVAR